MRNDEVEPTPLEPRHARLGQEGKAQTVDERPLPILMGDGDMSAVLIELYEPNEPYIARNVSVKAAY